MKVIRFYDRHKVLKKLDKELEKITPKYGYKQVKTLFKGIIEKEINIWWIYYRYGHIGVVLTNPKYEKSFVNICNKYKVDELCIHEWNVDSDSYRTAFEIAFKNK